MDFRIAAGASSGKFQPEVHGLDVTGQMTVPNTGAQTSSAVTKTGIKVASGTRVLKLTMDTNGSTGSARQLQLAEANFELT